jgi:hypothetical protein
MAEIASSASSIVLVPAARSVDSDGQYLEIVVEENPAHLAVLDYYDGDPGPDLLSLTLGAHEASSVGATALYAFVPVLTLSGDRIVVAEFGDAFARVTDVGDSLDGSLRVVVRSLVSAAP